MAGPLRRGPFSWSLRSGSIRREPRLATSSARRRPSRPGDTDGNGNSRREQTGVDPDPGRWSHPDRTDLAAQQPDRPPALQQGDQSQDQHRNQRRELAGDTRACIARSRGPRAVSSQPRWRLPLRRLRPRRRLGRNRRGRGHGQHSGCSNHNGGHNAGPHRTLPSHGEVNGGQRHFCRRHGCRRHCCQRHCCRRIRRRNIRQCRTRQCRTSWGWHGRQMQQGGGRF